MTRDEAVARILERLGFRSGLSTTIQGALQEAQQELEAAVELPWFLKSEYSSIQTTADEERVPVPTDFLRELEDDDTLQYYDADEELWIALGKELPHIARQEWQGFTGVKWPRKYSLDNLYFRLYPTPDDTYTLRMQYYKSDDVLDSNIENLWLTHRPNLLIGRAGIHVAASLHDDRALRYFTGLTTEQADVMQKEEVAREQAGSSKLVRGEED